jgi:hypothetical protein
MVKVFRLLDIVECRSFKVDGLWFRGVVIGRQETKKGWKYEVYTNKGGIHEVVERMDEDLRPIAKSRYKWVIIYRRI